MEVCCSVLLAKPGGLSRILKGAVWVEKDCSKILKGIVGLEERGGDVWRAFFIWGKGKGEGDRGKGAWGGVGAGVSWRQFLLEPEPV